MTIEAMKQALDALEGLVDLAHKAGFPCEKAEAVITALRQNIEEANKQEPVAWMYDWTTSEGEFIKDWTTSEAETLRDTEPTIISNVRPLYTHPQPKREPLTDEQIYEMYNEPRSDAEMLAFARAIEAAHGIKGEA